MPSTTKNSFKIPAIDGSELQSLPFWARSKYRKSQEVVFQLIQQVVKLESIIGNLETMLEQGECPRSLQVKINVSVSQDQQSNMDAAFLANKKIFEENMLKALIAARKSELLAKGALLRRERSEFKTFLETNLNDLLQNNIPIPPPDSDVNGLVSKAVQNYEERADMVMRQVKTQHFLMEKTTKRRKQERIARQTEERINQTLQDPAISSIMKRVSSLETRLRQETSRNNSRNGTNIFVTPGQRTNRVKKQVYNPIVSKKKVPNTRKIHPKDSGPSKTNNKTSFPRGKDGRGPGKRRQSVSRGPVKENRKRQRRYTNTMTQSASKPSGYRPKQN